MWWLYLWQLKQSICFSNKGVAKTTWKVLNLTKVIKIWKILKNLLILSYDLCVTSELEPRLN